MAEIDIQEKQGQPIWPWILGILALLVLVGVIWAVTRSGDDRDDAGMYQDTLPARDTLISELERVDGALAQYVAFSRQPMYAAADRGREHPST